MGDVTRLCERASLFSFFFARIKLVISDYHKEMVPLYHLIVLTRNAVSYTLYHAYKLLYEINGHARLVMSLMCLIYLATEFYGNYVWKSRCKRREMCAVSH